jgi:hypothetical protein
VSWMCTTLELEGRGGAVDVTPGWEVGGTVSAGGGVEVEVGTLVLV